MKRLISACCMLLALLLPTAAHCAAVVGQVNDDTDLFLVNPTIPAQRPNVVIIWDNTANWSQTVSGSTAYTIEKQALSTVINGLSDQFNIGLMLFTETGGGNSNVRGAYPRYHIRQMTADSGSVPGNRTNLRNLITGLTETGPTGDKGSNAQYARAMHEAYLYFGGRTALAGAGQVKRDYAAFGGSASGTTYVSPVGDGCQKNFIIFISNGSSDNGENNSAEALLNGLGGKLGGDPIALNPSSEQANWADEYSRFVASNDINPVFAERQTASVFTIAVYDPSKVNTNPVASQIALMKSMARQGKGEYFAGTDLSSIVAALEQIFVRVQAVNGVFASTTLPVSVNVRGTHLNQVYMGVFRPSSTLAPRWIGNLKMYTLALDSATQTVYLADILGNPAQDAGTGFVTGTGVSAWTTDSTFWSFRSAEENGAGGASDRPDGDLVEKGAIAQVLRTTYASSQVARKLYSCTGTCVAGSVLSATPFATSNGDITQAALGAASSGERDSIIDWVRGQDNNGDENANGSSTDTRASVHGDVLHSRPAVVNYNRNSPSDENDVIAFYGSNDGVFRAIKGGQGTGAGSELWGFVPAEFFGKLKRLRDNSPGISGTNKRPYFADGPIGVYQKDVNGDGKLVAADGDKAYLYVGMRRGGRFLYALDVSDPQAPRLLWKKTASDTGLAELGMTWSEPKVARIRAHANPVIIMGAGYDPNQDTDPTTLADAMGRGIVVLDAITGDPLWQAGPIPSGATHNLAVAGMTHSIPSDVTILDRNGDGYIDRIYVGDNGGNLWRGDLYDANMANWTVVKLASVGGSAADNRRKFQYPPDVVYGSDANDRYDAVLIGSGDREHPFEVSVVNRFYMFKDREVGLTSTRSSPMTEADLFDATANTIQVGSTADGTAANASLTGSSGWMMTLAAGEKVIGGSVTLAGTTFFNTNQPSSVASATCGSNLGIALQYAISYEDASATIDSGTAGLTTADRSIRHAGGGYLPSPVPVVVNLGGRLYQAVISGTEVRMPPQAKLESRYRFYWYIKRD
ncbi:MAG: pilus assembly protein PilY [Betaproteobacteria bacterium]|nr:pilus assembly protein PilY [Betaproteobacteria bacterium]